MDHITALLLVVDLDLLIDFAALAIRFARGEHAGVEDAAQASLLAAARNRAKRRTRDADDQRTAPAWLVELPAPQPRPPLPGFARKE